MACLSPTRLGKTKTTIKSPRFASATVIPRAHQDDARKLYAEAVKNEYGVDVSDVKMRIHWTEESCATGKPGLPYTEKGKEESCYGGLTWNCSEIYVAGHHDKLGNSALIHEIGHCYYRYVFGRSDDGDGKHQNKPWWRLVEQVDKELLKRGW